jgi:hypothetical protein
MKTRKFGLIAMSLWLATQMTAQETEFTLPSVEGDVNEYLPAAGDIALGTRWSTLVYAITNPIRKEPAADAQSFNPYEIFGKYYITDQMAARASIAMQRFSSFEDQRTSKTGAAQPEEFVMDRSELKDRSTLLKLGVEMRRGKKRFQGFYGGELVLGFASSYERYTYGNALTQDNPAVFSYNFDTNETNTITGNRVLGRDASGSRITGIRLFGGVEVFVSKKFSIAGEAGFGIYRYSTGTAIETRERMDNGTREVYQIDTQLDNKTVEIQTEILDGGSPADWAASAFGANLRAIFHF